MIVFPSRLCRSAVFASGFFAALCGPSTMEAGMTHRWSFNQPAGAVPAGTVVADIVTGVSARIEGTGAAFTGAVVTLPGSTTSAAAPGSLAAYVDLPNGMISSKRNLTVEIWATVHSHKSWQRLFEFGRANYANDTARQGSAALPGEVLPTATAAATGMSGLSRIMLVVNRGTSPNTQQFSAQLNGTEYGQSTNLGLGIGTSYHYVVTYQEGQGALSSTGGRFKWYLNGVVRLVQDVPYRLSSVSDVNNWLGRPQDSGHSCSHISYDEVRFYDHAMSDAEVLASRSAGANAIFPVPVAVNDIFSLNPATVARLPVLDNDGGPFTASTVSVVDAPTNGTVTLDGSGRMIYRHTGSGAGSDVFTYRVGGPGGTSAIATVNVEITDNLRLPGKGFRVPATPPPVTLSAVNAFPGLNFSMPICATSPPADTGRLFIGSRTGAVRVIPDVTALTATSNLVLDMSPSGLFAGRVPAEALVNSPEMGLLGMAFHPQFAANGHLFLSYSLLLGGKHYHRVSRITLNQHLGPAPVADPATERVLIEQEDNAVSHNGGDLHFGPDGYLYISLGDEGDQNDSHGNGQRINKDFFSGILRIDVDKRPGNPEPSPHPNPADFPTLAQQDAVKRDAGVARYSVPLDNPFVPTGMGGPWNGAFNGEALPDLTHVRTEFWAVGLRHPWRMWIDPLDGEIWAGDVGGDLREEIDVVKKGENHGWGYLEGDQPGPRTNPPSGFSPVAPLYQYTHPIPWGSTAGPFQGSSVTGGFIYRGTGIPQLNGAYVFADYVGGNIWSLVRNANGPPTVNRILGEAGIAAFARDPSNGDILLLDYPENRILRIALTTSTADFPAKLSETELFADLATLAPAPGLLPYSVNLPFWSDHAVKRRWFTIPDLARTMDFSADGTWSFPSGQIWVKHFELETTRGIASPIRRIETRLLVKTDAAAYGVSYRWNDAGSEAHLVEDAGQEITIQVTVDGATHNQRWRFPSRSDCMTCHTPQAGHSLSFNTRQLNLAGGFGGVAGNQLSLLGAAGYFSGATGDPSRLPRHLRPDDNEFALEARVRSYLAVNCAHCHRPEGTAAPAQWDGRPQTPLFETGLMRGLAVNDGGNPLARLVLPGHPENSILLQRVAATGGLSRMPPLATNELDSTAIDLLTDWIALETPARHSYDEWRTMSFGSSVSLRGSPAADPDGDGVANRSEFLSGSPPLSGSGNLVPAVTFQPDTVTVSFTLSPGRSGLVEVSEDLKEWTPWNVPANTGIPSNGGHHVLTGPRGDGGRFFRVKLQEL